MHEVKYLLSIVIPIYNVENYLNMCLDSIAEQCDGDIEVVLVNDGSTDSSKEIAEKYSERYENWILCNRTNGGLSAARNTGIENAHGEFVWFVDSDDYIDSNAIAVIRKKLLDTEKKVSVLKFSAHTFDEISNEEIAYYIYKGKYDEVLPGKSMLFHMNNCGDLRLTTAWSLVVNREFLYKHGIEFYEGILLEDNLFMYQVMYYADAVAIFDFPIYWYRRNRPGAITVNKNAVRKFYGIYITIHEANRMIVSKEDKELLSGCIREYIEFFVKITINCYDEIKVNKQYMHYKKEIDRIIRRNGFWKSINLFLFTFSPRLSDKYKNMQRR